MLGASRMLSYSECGGLGRPIGCERHRRSCTASSDQSVDLRASEDFRWPDDAPVGRELGSPDYELLMALYQDAFAASRSLVGVER